MVLATPLHKAGGLLPHVDSVRTIVRKNNHSFVIEIDKAQMMRHLEGEQREVGQSVSQQDNHF